MTVSELQVELHKLNYDVPLRMLTFIWKRATVDRIYQYVLWRTASHRGPGRPMEEPRELAGFYIASHARKPMSRAVLYPDLPAGYKVCWTLKGAKVEITE